MHREKKGAGGNAGSAVIRRGDVYYADLDPVIGSEQAGVRPAVVIQNDMGNIHSATVIVAATTSKMDKPHLPTHIFVRAKHSIFPQDSLILLEQIRTIDRSRLVNYIGRLDGSIMQRIDNALTISFGLINRESEGDEDEHE